MRSLIFEVPSRLVEAALLFENQCRFLRSSNSRSITGLLTHFCFFNTAKLACFKFMNISIGLILIFILMPATIT